MGYYECLFVMGLNQQTLTFKQVPHTSTVKDFKQIIHEKTGMPIDGMRLIYGGKALEDDKTLKNFYNVQDNQTFHLVLRLNGGAKDDLEFTSDACQVCQQAPSGDQRVNMPCCESRHPICGECLVALVRSTIEPKDPDSLAGYIIRCTIPSCRGEWNWTIVKEVMQQLGGLSDKELEDVTLKHTLRLLQVGWGVKECNGCKSLCERKDPKNPRVNCQMCVKLNNGNPVPDFCWFCGNTWIGNISYTSSAATGVMGPCGNHGCTGRDFRLDCVKNCKTKDIGLAKNVPSIRLCTNCGFIVEHRSNCVHMDCPQCLTKFCMSCLKENNVCSYTGTCTVAPRQEVIPILSG